MVVVIFDVVIVLVCALVLMIGMGKVIVALSKPIALMQMTSSKI